MVLKWLRHRKSFSTFNGKEKLPTLKYCVNLKDKNDILYCITEFTFNIVSTEDKTSMSIITKMKKYVMILVCIMNNMTQKLLQYVQNFLKDGGLTPITVYLIPTLSGNTTIIKLEEVTKDTNDVVNTGKHNVHHRSWLIVTMLKKVDYSFFPLSQKKKRKFLLQPWVQQYSYHAIIYTYVQ